MIPGSSVVEQAAVNRLVAGSNPARGAILFRLQPYGKIIVIPGSSVVEQAAVNRLVAGSNPARGATSFIDRSQWQP